MRSYWVDLHAEVEEFALEDRRKWSSIGEPERTILKPDADNPHEVALGYPEHVGRAVHEALYHAPALVLLYAPTQRQSELLYGKVRAILRALEDVPEYQEDTKTSLQLSTGSRVVCLPGDEATTRGFSGVNLLVIDEASRCSDLLYAAVRPMLAVSGGRIVLLSTPWGQRGFYWEVWTNGGPAWHRVKVTAQQCPRITAEWLALERASIPERLFRQEYECSFEDVESQVFPTELVTEAFTSDVKPLFAGGVR